MTATLAPLEAVGPNAEEIEKWNMALGEKWARNNAHLERFMAPILERLMQQAAPAPGEAVLDIGCGAGSTSRAAAQRVGAQGYVLGIDISAPMLNLAQAQSATPAAFMLADAAQYRFPEARFDLALSRFGVMFFSDPAAAFANIRKAIKPGGRLVFMCWQALPANGWVAVPVQAVLKHVPAPAPSDPHAPGPFAFADPAYVEGILRKAGFHAIGIEPVAFSLLLAPGGPNALDEATFHVSEVGPASRLLDQADDAAREAARHSIREALAPYQTAKGVALGAACWLVAARA